jgi:uncharacterized protein YbjT (DUF2867 family)
LTSSAATTTIIPAGVAEESGSGKVLAVESQSVQRTALVAGGSGLVGGALLRLLLGTNDYSRIHAITRRPLPLDHPRLANRILKIEDLGPRLTGLRCNDAFCCIGAAGGPRATPEALRQVDLALVLTFARAAMSAGATRLVVVSAAGAERAATQPFQRVKAEMEAALRDLKPASLDLLQPGPVLGVRAASGAGDYLRLGLLPMLNPLRRGKLESSRAIAADDLAAAMLGAARSQRRGVYAYAGESLLDLATAGRRQP